MKKLIALWVILTVAICVCFADPVEGFWISVDDKTNKATAGWEIYQQGGKLYGKILSIAGFPQEELAKTCKESYQGFPVAGKVNQMRVVGTSWIFGLTQSKAGQWSGGHVIDPNDGKMYKCKITFRPADGKRYATDTLEMRGEIGLGIGRSQFWRKSTRMEASGLR
jgi:uncharacterized protein (DUF2147 family)